MQVPLCIASTNQVIVEGSIGPSRRTDCNRGEVQLGDGVGGDGAGDRVLLPVSVGVVD